MRETRSSVLSSALCAILAVIFAVGWAADHWWMEARLKESREDYFDVGALLTTAEFKIMALEADVDSLLQENEQLKEENERLKQQLE